MMLWNIRSARGSDLNFIYSTWMNSFWSDSQKPYRTAESFQKFYPQIIDYLLSVSNIAIACKKDEEDVIYGYAIAQRPVAHYVFVKEDFRNMGIASSLLERLEAGDVYTHSTGTLRRILRHQPDNRIYNPYLLLRREANE